MALTKKEKAIVIKAAAMVASGYETYSCFALARAQGKDIAYLDPLTRKYGEFLGLQETVFGTFKAIGSPDYGFHFGTLAEIEELRVLALLSFAEVG